MLESRPPLEFREQASEKLLSELTKACATLGIDGTSIIPLGLHGDGVPHSKKGSIECFSWNFGGLPHMERMLCAVVDKRFSTGRPTTDRIIEVLTWSFRCILAGEYPERRHDSSGWLPSDQDRSKLHSVFGAKGMLVQVRGDWSWYNQVFSFPSWSSKAICWKCRANADTMPWKDCSAGARWRSNRYTDRAFWKAMRDAGVQACPLFALPGFRLAFIGIDVLHAFDLGVT